MKSLLGTTLVAVIIGTFAGSAISSMVWFDPQAASALYYLASNTVWLFGFGVLVAGFAMLVYGYPAYFLLARLGAANWATAILVGVLPGVLAFFFARDALSLPILLCGLVISVVFFWLMGKRSPVNQSMQSDQPPAGR